MTRVSCKMREIVNIFHTDTNGSQPSNCTSTLQPWSATMNAARHDEKPKTWFRSERVFLSDEKWFFHTREGVDVGPYDSQFEAEIEAGMLKEVVFLQMADLLTLLLATQPI